ncbi:MAG TPA: hypothetical protein VMU14_08230, partial [Acidimicrobiales bacterium]|nr:hypothetical protein [Acidimicrobiales bacterium]
EDAAAVLDGPRVAVGDTLRDALVAILDSPLGVVAVEDGSGSVLGALRAESVYAAARRSLADGTATTVDAAWP